MRIGRISYARPPLGIAYLASYVRKNLSHPVEVSLIDSVADNIQTPEELITRLVMKRPDVVGFSVVTATRDIVGELLPMLVPALPRATFVMGGPHVTALPNESAPGCSAIFIGEGEETFVEYLREVVLGQRDVSIQGCIQLREGKAISRFVSRALIEHLDKIPFPARDLLPNDAYYHSYPHRYRRFTTMFTSRGCPHNCSFCSNELMWHRKVRFFSLEYTFAEIDRITDRESVDLVFIEDDTFLANKPRAYAIMEYIRGRHQNLKWICHTRADTLDAKIVAEMEASNCVEVQIGVESGSEKILRRDKNLSLSDIRHAFSLLRRTKIKTWATFIIGADGETHETVRQSVRLAKEIDPTYASFIILLPLPGTEVYELFKSQRYLNAKNWSDFSWHGKPIFSTETLSVDELIELRAWAFRSFFLRPRKLFAILGDMLKAGTTREVLRNMLSWISLAFPWWPRDRLTNDINKIHK